MEYHNNSKMICFSFSLGILEIPDWILYFRNHRKYLTLKRKYNFIISIV